MERIVVVKSRDGRFLARYPISLPRVDQQGAPTEFFKLAAQNAVEDRLASEAEVSKLIFELET